MADELKEQRMAELNTRNTEKVPAFDSKRRVYSRRSGWFLEWDGPGIVSRSGFDGAFVPCDVQVCGHHERTAR